MRRAPLILVGICLLAMTTTVRAASDTEAQNAELRTALVAAQQEIVALRAQVAAGQNAEAMLKAARDKNERLAAIANALIASYEKRFGRRHFLPFDTGRRQLEVELQNVGDQIYDNRWEVGNRREMPVPATQQPPSPR